MFTIIFLNNETECNTFYDFLPYSMDSKPLLFPFPHPPSQKTQNVKIMIMMLLTLANIYWVC